jgi:hypothetical protein
MMSTATHPACTATYGAAGQPAWQVTWTRLGNTLGYTNTEAKRAEIRDGIERMAWRDPDELADLLSTAPARQVIASLFYGRPWALDRAAVATLPADPAGRDRCLIGLACVTGERYVLLHASYEVVDLRHDHPATGPAGSGFEERPAGGGGGGRR